MATKVIYIFLTTLFLGINAWAYYGLEYQMVCLTCCMSLMLSCSLIPHARKPAYRQQTMAVLPCGKPQLILMRMGEVLQLPEVIAFYGISALAIGKAEIAIGAKVSAMLLHMLAVCVCVAFGVMLENLRSNSKEAKRNIQQVPLLIGIIGNLFVTQQIGTEAFALFCPLWYGIVLALAVAAAALFPFAKRWSL